MNTFKKALLGTAITTAAAGFASVASADVLDELVKGGSVYGNVLIRYEGVETDTGSDNATTMRTWIGFKSGSYHGFSTLVEFEDVRPIFGEDEHNGMIADPEQSLTELDQAYVQYKNDAVTAKVGRQVITLDNHRYVGHVAWRQDKQTFDAARVELTPAKDLKLDLSYVYGVNRINSPAFSDVDTDHILFNASYKTPVGKVAAYYYDLSEDGLYKDTSTIGAYLNGSAGSDIKALYKVEYAVQDNESLNAETEYSLIEAGLKVSGVTAKIGVETLGGDTDAGTNFVTPLATVHAFQGWADTLLGGSLNGNIDGGNGVEDTYFSIGGKVAGIKLLGVYHDFESAEGSADLGSEYNLLAVKSFGKKYSVGLKYADFAKGDSGSDKEVMWAWVNAKF